MAHEEKKIEFLNLAHEIQARTEREIAKCESIIQNPDVPDVVKIWFLEVQTALKLQATLSKNLMEANLEIEDHIDALIARANTLTENE